MDGINLLLLATSKLSYSTDLFNFICFVFFCCGDALLPPPPPTFSKVPLPTFILIIPPPLPIYPYT